MPSLVVTMKSGDVRRFEADTAKAAHGAIALCVGVYHYLPVGKEERIELEDIEKLEVED